MTKEEFVARYAEINAEYARRVAEGDAEIDRAVAELHAGSGDWTAPASQPAALAGLSKLQRQILVKILTAWPWETHPTQGVKLSYITYRMRGDDGVTRSLSAALSRAISRLEERGLVERPGATNKKHKHRPSTHVRLTGEGKPVALWLQRLTSQQQHAPERES